jgi:hypothetical protein
MSRSSRVRVLALRSMAHRRLLLVFAWSTMGACSADSVAEPEPTLDTKGAFIAVAADDGDYQLFRSLAVLGDGSDDDAFFVVPYVEKPKTFAQARELAQNPSLKGKDVIAIGRRYITSRDWRVVWFRSVSSEEEAQFR